MYFTIRNVSIRLCLSAGNGICTCCAILQTRLTSRLWWIVLIKTIALFCIVSIYRLSRACSFRRIIVDSILAMIVGSCTHASHIITVVKHIVRLTNQAVLLFSSSHQLTCITLSYKCSSVDADVTKCKKISTVLSVDV